MKRACNKCGKMDDENWMHKLGYGRSATWLCHKCYRETERDVIASEVRSQKRYRKTVER